MTAAAVLLVLGLLAVAVPRAAAGESLGNRILDWSETQTGCWYSYGGAGPCSHGYDCSGIVYAAARHLGVTLPRTTYGLAAGGPHLYRIPLSQARRGDLLFYGSGHVEIDTIWPHTSFGAQHTGTRVGWHSWNGYWHPVFAMRLR